MITMVEVVVEVAKVEPDSKVEVDLTVTVARKTTTLALTTQ